jgi:hypothetical protein
MVPMQKRQYSLTQGETPLPAMVRVTLERRTNRYNKAWLQRVLTGIFHEDADYTSDLFNPLIIHVEQGIHFGYSHHFWRMFAFSCLSNQEIEVVEH